MKSLPRPCPGAAHELGRLSVAVCSALHRDIAIAPCAFAVMAPAADAGNLVELQVLPAGDFKPRDGRPMPKSGSWHIDAALAAKVIAAFNARKTPIVLDYEHQTLQAEENGKPAPAAGFFKSLEWREGQGLYATVDLTANAASFVRGGEYKYFSPVFSYDRDTGDVLEILMGALTNYPALDGMAPIAMRAAARFAFHDTNEDSIVKNKLLLAVCTALAITFAGRDESEVETEAITALGTLKDKPDPIAQMRKDLGLADDATATAVTTAIAALKTKADANKPDPAKFVGIEVVDELRKEVATLSAKRNQDDVDQLIESGLQDGRLLKSMEPWARELGKKDVAQLKAYIDAATPIAALNGSQTGGKKPAVEGNEHELNADEVAICKLTGVGEKEFAAAKKAA